MTAEALEGIESEIQKFVVQVGSKEIKWQGYGARMNDRRWGHPAKLRVRGPPVGQQLVSRSGGGGEGGGQVEHPKKA